MRSRFSQWYHWKFYQWYHWYPENPERFSAANGTIGANVTIDGNVGTNGTICSPNGTIGKPNGTIGKPNGVNSSIMINTSNLFLYSYFFMFPIIC